MDAEGAESQITRLEHGPSNARWSPDGDWVAFTSQVNDNAEFADVQLPSRPDSAKWTGEPKVVERAGYKRDRMGYIDTGWTHLFTAASANCPIVNWMSAMGTSDYIGYTRTFETPFWEDATEWIDRSSIFYVENVTTPTMLMTGENDLRTPMGQTEEYYQALQYLDVPTVMVRFQDEWHGTTSKPSNFMRTQLYLRKWFEKWGTHDDDERIIS